MRLQSDDEIASDSCAPLAFKSVISVGGVVSQVQYMDIIEVDGANFGTQIEHITVSLSSSVAGCVTLVYMNFITWRLMLLHALLDSQ